MISESRVNEMLDYASCYGDYDENTPNGTTSTSGSPMNEQRRAAIVAYKIVLGIIPDDMSIQHTKPLPPESAKLLAGKAALRLLQENAELIEVAEQFEMSLTVPIKGTTAKARVVMVVRVEG